MLNTLRFIKEFCRHPGQTGAIAPSSRGLAQAVVKALGPVPPGKLVIELGPGTGSFTRAVRRLLPDNPLLAIERNEHFVEQLERRFPEVQIAHGCASEIRKAIRAKGMEQHDVAGIISGLPLLSLPKPLIRAIFTSLADVLPTEAPFINFTYSKRSFLKRLDAPGFAVVETKRVLLNVPPATVMTIRQTGTAVNAG